MSEAALRTAVDVLRRGGVVAHASEGVWGLACDPFDADAAAKVLAIKGRDAAKGLLLIAADASGFAPEIEPLDGDTQARIFASWPGATTWVVANHRFDDWITGGRRTVAIRVPGHDQARALASAFGGPLVSTSANRSGEPPALAQQEVQTRLGDAVDYLLPGETGGRRGPSRIVDAATGAVLR